MGRKRRELGVRAEIQDEGCGNLVSMVTGSGSPGRHAEYSAILPKRRQVEKIGSLVSNQTPKHLSLLKEMDAVTQKESSKEHIHVVKEIESRGIDNRNKDLCGTTAVDDKKLDCKSVESVAASDSDTVNLEKYRNAQTIDVAEWPETVDKGKNKGQLCMSVSKLKGMPDMSHFQLTLEPPMLASDPGEALIRNKNQKDEENRRLSCGKLGSLQTEKEKGRGKPKKDGGEYTDNVEKWSKEEMYKDYFGLLPKREGLGQYGEALPEDLKMSCQWKGMENRGSDEVKKPLEPKVIDKAVLVEVEKNSCIDNRTLEDG